MGRRESMGSGDDTMARWLEILCLLLGIIGAFALSASTLFLLWAPTSSPDSDSWEALLNLMVSADAARIPLGLWFGVLSLPLVFCGLYVALERVGLLDASLRVAVFSLTSTAVALSFGMRVQVANMAQSFLYASSTTRLADAAYGLWAPYDAALQVLLWGSGAVLGAALLLGRTRAPRYGVLALPQVYYVVFMALSGLLDATSQLALSLVAWPLALAFSFALLLPAGWGEPAPGPTLTGSSD